MHPQAYAMSASEPATEGGGGAERAVPMAAALLAFYSVPVTFLRALFALFVQQTFIGGQPGTGDVAMGTGHATPHPPACLSPQAPGPAVLSPSYR